MTNQIYTKYQENLRTPQQKVQQAIDWLSDEMEIAFILPYAINNLDDFKLVWIWTTGQKGVVNNGYDYLKEGVEVQITDTGVKIYIETPYGTVADVTLNNAICTTVNIKQVIKMALEGTK